MWKWEPAIHKPLGRYVDIHAWDRGAGHRVACIFELFYAYRIRTASTYIYIGLIRGIRTGNIVIHSLGVHTINDARFPLELGGIRYGGGTQNYTHGNIWDIVALFIREHMYDPMFSMESIPIPRNWEAHTRYT